MRSILKTLTLLAVVAGTATTAEALSPTAPLRDGVPTVAITVKDLDLSKKSDVHRLRRRIADGLEAVCGSYAEAPIDQDIAITACRRHALADLPPAVLALVMHTPTRQA